MQYINRLFNNKKGKRLNKGRAGNHALFAILIMVIVLVKPIIITRIPNLIH